MTLAPNTVVQGRYRIVRPVGKGGMGAVYEAIDERLSQTVALKQTLVTGTQLNKAFEREAKILAGLRHPALTRVIDYFSDDNEQFLVMDFVQGDDLGTLLKQRNSPFPIDLVLNWADQVLNALEYLHHQSPPVIHRDIKPQNLKLTTEGQIILLDFGLAKGTSSLQSQISTTGSIFGYTPQYAPLEQVQGTGTDPRSDLYSLAAMLYHLLVGSPPEDALTRVIASTNNQPDPLRPAHARNPDIPSALGTVLNQALSLQIDMRPATATIMRTSLNAIYHSLPDSSRSQLFIRGTHVANAQRVGYAAPGHGQQTRAGNAYTGTTVSPSSGMPPPQSPPSPAPYESDAQSSLHTAPPAQRSTLPIWLWLALGGVAIISIVLLAFMLGRTKERQTIFIPADGSPTTVVASPQPTNAVVGESPAAPTTPPFTPIDENLLSGGGSGATPASKNIPTEPPATVEISTMAPPTSAPSLTPQPTVDLPSSSSQVCGQATVVEVTALSIRADHTRSSERLGEVGQGNTVDVLCVEPVDDDDRTWVRVRHGTIEGWMSTRYLSESMPSGADDVCGQATVVDVTALSIRANHTRNSERLGEVGQGNTVDVLCVEPVDDDDRTWVKVRYGTIEGWMSTRYLKR
jgi:serine/threonine protein kinase/uncharacterized protein YraI